MLSFITWFYNTINNTIASFHGLYIIFISLFIILFYFYAFCFIFGLLYFLYNSFLYLIYNFVIKTVTILMNELLQKILLYVKFKFLTACFPNYKVRNYLKITCKQIKFASEAYLMRHSLTKLILTKNEQVPQRMRRGLNFIMCEKETESDPYWHWSYARYVKNYERDWKY